MEISDKTTVGMPIRNLVSIVTAVALGVYAYFGIVETLNQHSTRLELMEKDLELNTEFRIKWPRGLMGSLPADSEQFMLIENLYKDIEKIKKQLEDGMHNKVNIQFLQKQMDKVLVDIEKLKDANREMKYTNGKH